MAEDMENALSCSICMELYKDPMLLPCLHTLCKVCLDQLRTNPIRCPLCNRQLNVGDLQNVKKNFQLAAIVEVYKSERNRRLTQQQSKRRPNDEAEASALGAVGPIDHSANLTVPGAEACPACDRDSPSTANVHCSNCEMSLCGACLSLYHPLTVSVMTSHDVRPIKEIKVNEKCTICKREKWAVYCMECQILFCQTCQFGFHPENHWVYKQTPERPISLPTPNPTRQLPQRERHSTPATSMTTGEQVLASDISKVDNELIKIQSGLMELMLLKQALMFELTFKVHGPQ